MPSLYFNYHIGGTRVSIYSKQGPVSSFILNMCAVIGGIYALAHFCIIHFCYFWVQNGVSITCSMIFYNSQTIRHTIESNHLFHIFCFFSTESFGSSKLSTTSRIFFQEFKSIWSINICTFSPSPSLNVWGHSYWIFATTTPSSSGFKIFIFYTNLTFYSIFIS